MSLDQILLIPGIAGDGAIVPVAMLAQEAGGYFLIEDNSGILLLE